MNSIYPCPMDGDIVSYENKEGEYVWGEIAISMNGDVLLINNYNKEAFHLSDPTHKHRFIKALQWIKRKDGTPLVNVGDEILNEGFSFVKVLEVGVNTFTVSHKNRAGYNAVDRMYSYLELKAAIEEFDWAINRKYPLPDKEVEDKKTEVTMDEIAEKFGVDVEDLKIKKEE